MNIKDFKQETLLAVLQKMILIRELQDYNRGLYQSGQLPGHEFSYRGQEAIATGVCSALEPADVVSSSHRADGHLIAKGAELVPLFKETLGRVGGYSQGRGGIMHMGRLPFGFLCSNGVVGATVPIAVGAALAAKYKGGRQVVVSFFGDGAANQGVVQEAMNMAGLWDLPIIFVLENNGFAMSTSQDRSTKIENYSVRATGYGFEGKTLDGSDVLAVMEASRQAVDRARQGCGPTLLECKVRRWDGHHWGDPGTAYRTQEDIEAARQICPIQKFYAKLLEAKIISQEAYGQMVIKAKLEIEEAIKIAKEASEPDPATLTDFVYA